MATNGPVVPEINPGDTIVVCGQRMIVGTVYLDYGVYPRWLDPYMPPTIESPGRGEVQLDVTFVPEPKPRKRAGITPWTV